MTPFCLANNLEDNVFDFRLLVKMLRLFNKFKVLKIQPLPCSFQLAQLSEYPLFAAWPCSKWPRKTGNSTNLSVFAFI